ncbi:MAG: beta-N-acetylhexosaminidase, partial [Candidatus Eremiobacteraeota bacterium]|nr:beta-N-acetylhexosaminidase [Candidatus Eremiobacteraeota bacterium]
MIATLAMAALAFAASSAQATDDLESLTPRQLAGQRVIEALPGRRPPRALLGRIRRGEVAGVILFSRNIGSKAEVRALVARLQREPRPAAVDAPLLVMVDQEGGLVKRLVPRRGRPRSSAGSAASPARARRVPR